MSHASTTDILNCTTGQLRTLLGLAVDRPGEYGALLARVRDLDEVERLLTEVQQPLNLSKPILADLASRETPLTGLREIRELGKRLIECAKTDPQREAAVFVYHTATAAALGRHGINLSSVPPQSRLPFYEDLATALATHPLAEVYREAVDYLAAPGEI